MLNPAMKLLLLFLALPLAAAAQTFRSDEQAFRVVTLVEGLDHPWSLAFLPDGRMLVTEKEGLLRSITGGKLDEKPIEGLPPVEQYGQGGLHDVVPHPQFASNRLIYFSYSKPSADTLQGTTAVARARRNRGRFASKLGSGRRPRIAARWGRSPGRIAPIRSAR